MNNNYTDITHEIQLAAQARDGSKDAFCELYGLYKDRLYRYALYRLDSPSDAEDAVSDCVLAAWEGLPRLRNTEAFGAWLFRILRNICAARIRDTVGLRENMQRIYDSGTGSSAEPSHSMSPSVSAELKEALSLLSGDELEIVLLSVIGDLTSREISDLTGLTPGSVRSKLSRSLAKMREFLS